MDEHLLEEKGAKGVEAQKETVEECLEKECNDERKRKLAALKEQLEEKCKNNGSVTYESLLSRRQSFIQNLATKLYVERLKNLDNICMNKALSIVDFYRQINKLPYNVTVLAHDVANVLIDSGAL